MLPSNPRLRGELWLVLPTLLFDALVEGGKLEGNTLVVPADVREEVEDSWGMIQGAFERAGYNGVGIKHSA